MKLLFDTNILVSAFLSKGRLADAVKDAFKNHNVFLTPFILQEFKKTLHHKLRFSSKDIDDYLQFIQKFSHHGQTGEIACVTGCPDAGDRQLLADATANDIDIIVTGDKAFLSMKRYLKIRIVSAQDYWKL